MRVRDYFILDPYRVNIQKTVDENIVLLDDYIHEYKIDIHTVAPMVDFALRYLIVKTTTYIRHRPRWITEFFDKHLRTHRRRLNMHRIIYCALNKKPDRVFAYLRNREIGSL